MFDENGSDGWHDRELDIPELEGVIVAGIDEGNWPNLDLKPTEPEVRKHEVLAFPSTMQWCCQWPAEPEFDMVWSEET